jgi:BolA protein
MSIQEIINEKILKEFCPNHLVIVNESHLHSGPSQDSHFKITIVSEFFSGVARVKRHQKIYKSLEIELNSGVHALALHVYSPAEFAAKVIVPNSPDCKGGSK